MGWWRRQYGVRSGKTEVEEKEEDEERVCGEAKEEERGAEVEGEEVVRRCTDSGGEEARGLGCRARGGADEAPGHRGKSGCEY